jgi:ribosomal RNA assembly protein
MLKLSYDKKEIANIIGKKGKKIKEFLKATKARLKIVDGNVEIENLGNLKEYEAVEMFDAMALGFSAKAALLLKNPDYSFEKINMKARLRPTRRKVIKGRMIGRKGKTVRIIKQLTDCDVKIFDNMVGIIGKYESVKIAKLAIEKLLHGKHHEAVYRWLRRESEKIETTEELTRQQLQEIE